jgi:predicted outer membrane protein
MATRNKNSTGRLSEIVSYRRNQGGSVSSSLAGGIKDRLKEKFDPRQLINQQGLLTALFPSLKTYQAKTAASDISKSSLQTTSFNEIKPILETIDFNTKVTAKSTMVLPALHRDVNVIRQNIVKLVKMKGGDARTKADMYFVKSKEREEKYERELRKENSKRSKIEKLEEKEKDKKTSFLIQIFSSLFSTIKKGLASILSALLGLGKLLVGAFKFMANVILDIAKSLTTFLLTTLTAALSKIPGLDKILGGIAKFLATGFLKVLARSLIGSVLQLLFRPKVLLRIGAGLLAFFAGAFGLSLLPEARKEVNMLQDSLKNEKDIYDQMVQEKSQYTQRQGLTSLPESGKTLQGEELEKAKLLGIVGEGSSKQAMLGSAQGKTLFDASNMSKLPNPELAKSWLSQTFSKEAAEDFYSGKKGLYGINVPGLNGVHEFLLTKEEATQYGDMQRDFVSMLRKVAELQKSDVLGNHKRVEKIRGEIAFLKGEMLEKVSGFSKTRNQSDEQMYLRTIARALAGTSAGYLDVYTEKLTDSFMNLDLVKNFQKNLETETEKYTNSLNLPTMDASFFMPDRDTTVNLMKDLRSKLEARTKDFDSSVISNLTSEVRQKSVVFKQPIIVDNTNVKKDDKQSSVITNPSSAWNIEFIDDIFKQSSFISKNN